MFRTCFGPVAALAVFLLLSLASPAHADDQDDPVPGREATEERATDVSGILVHSVSNAADGGTTILSAEEVERRGGDVVSRKPVRSGMATTASAAASGYTCVKKTTSSSNLKAYTPWNIDYSSSEWEIHYTDHSYSMGYARYVSGQWTTQFEQCAIGGSKNKTWHRLAMTESEVSIGAKQNRKVGAKWGTGVKDGAVSSAINFSVSAAKAVTISGSLPVSTGGSFKGSIGAGECGSIGSHSGNQVNATWEFNYPGYGTADFKGNVGHALYEFATPNKTSFTKYFQACRARRY